MSAQTLVLRKNDFTQYSITTPSSQLSLLAGAAMHTLAAPITGGGMPMPYLQLIESNNDKVPNGSLLYGIWPPSTAPVDLILEELEPGLLRETSSHRQTMKPMYNRYLLHDTATHEDML
ncbi:hypothetical protein MY3296_000257 [Beauveria thailandica]